MASTIYLTTNNESPINPINIDSILTSSGNNQITYSTDITTIGTYSFSEPLYSGYYDPIYLILDNDNNITNDDEPVYYNRVIESNDSNESYCDTGSIQDFIISDKIHPLTSITLPSTVTKVDTEAFSNCINLTTIKLPANARFIGKKVFKNCISLTTINNLSNTAFVFKNVEDLLFLNCQKLSSVSLDSSITTIGLQAFELCLGLTSIELPSSLTTIKRAAFHYAGLINVVIPNSVTTIEQEAFKGCPLESITISNNLTEMPKFFLGHTKITECTIPSSVTTIGISCFECCYYLKTVNIPTSVTTIGAYAFANCPNISTINYSGTLEQWSSITISSSAYTGGWQPLRLNLVLVCTDGTKTLKTGSSTATVVHRFTKLISFRDCSWQTICFPLIQTWVTMPFKKYTVTLDDSDELVLTEDTKAFPTKNVPYLIYSNDRNDFVITGKLTDKSSSCNKGVLSADNTLDITLPTNSYKLKTVEGQTNFYLGTETVNQYEAYLIKS